MFTYAVDNIGRGSEKHYQASLCIQYLGHRHLHTVTYRYASKMNTILIVWLLPLQVLPTKRMLKKQTSHFRQDHFRNDLYLQHVQMPVDTVWCNITPWHDYLVWGVQKWCDGWAAWHVSEWEWVAATYEFWIVSEIIVKILNRLTILRCHYYWIEIICKLLTFSFKIM